MPGDLLPVQLQELAPGKLLGFGGRSVRCLLGGMLVAYGSFQKDTGQIVSFFVIFLLFLHCWHAARVITVILLLIYLSFRLISLGVHTLFMVVNISGRIFPRMLCCYPNSTSRVGSPYGNVWIWENKNSELIRVQAPSNPSAAVCYNEGVFIMSPQYHCLSHVSRAWIWVKELMARKFLRGSYVRRMISQCFDEPTEFHSRRVASQGVWKLSDLDPTDRVMTRRWEMTQTSLLPPVPVRMEQLPRGGFRELTDHGKMDGWLDWSSVLMWLLTKTRNLGHLWVRREWGMKS